jgi:hypothetical protein
MQVQLMQDFSKIKPNKTGFYMIRTGYGDEYQRVWCDPWKAWYDINCIAVRFWRILSKDEIPKKELVEDVSVIEDWS